MRARVAERRCRCSRPFAAALSAFAVALAAVSGPLGAVAAAPCASPPLPAPSMPHRPLLHRDRRDPRTSAGIAATSHPLALAEPTEAVAAPSAAGLSPAAAYVVALLIAVLRCAPQRYWRTCI